jgi:hypothetical protein
MRTVQQVWLSSDGAYDGTLHHVAAWMFNHRANRSGILSKFISPISGGANPWLED